MGLLTTLFAFVVMLSVLVFVHEAGHFIAAKLCGVRLTLLRRILFEEGGERLAALCKVAGLDKHAFVMIFMRFRQGRLGSKTAADEELKRAIAFFEEVEIDAARALLRHWRKDPDYLSARRMVEQK